MRFKSAPFQLASWARRVADIRFPLLKRCFSWGVSRIPIAEHTGACAVSLFISPVSPPDAKRLVLHYPPEAAGLFTVDTFQFSSLSATFAHRLLLTGSGPTGETIPSHKPFQESAPASAQQAPAGRDATTLLPSTRSSPPGDLGITRRTQTLPYSGTALPRLKPTRQSGAINTA